MSNLIGIILRSMEYGSIYALASLSIILVYRTSFTTNFAQGVLGMFNTYLVATLIHKQGLSLYAALPLGILSALAIGFLIDIVVIRRAKRVSPVGKQIITLGLLSIILGLAPMIFGVYDLTMPHFINAGRVNILGASISYNALFNIIIGIVLMGLMFFILQKTKWGLAIRTTASNEVTARLMGVPTKTVTMVTWGIAGVLSLIAGVMASPFSVVSLTFMNDVQITALLAAVFGGLQTFHGPVVAAYILAIVGNLLQIYLPNGTVWGKPVMYMLLIVFLYFKPYGLFGKKVVKKV